MRIRGRIRVRIKVRVLIRVRVRVRVRVRIWGLGEATLFTCGCNPVVTSFCRFVRSYHVHFVG